MTALSRLLGLLGRIAPQAMAAGVFLGLLLPDVATVMRPALPPAVWALLTLAMLRIEWTDLMAQVRRPVLAVSVVGWMLLVTPALMAALMALVELRPGLEAALVLSAASSPLFSAPTLGIMFGLDGALLLVVLLAGTFLMPLTMPVFALWFLGLDMGTEPLVLMGRMAAFVLSAAVVAVVLRRALGGERVRRMAAEIDGTSVILLILFAVAIMDGLTARMLADPWDIAGVTALSFASYIGLMIAGGIAFAVLAPRVGKRGSLSVAFISGTRNLAIILAVLPDGADPDIALFFAVGQFPIYIMPMVLKPVFERLLGTGKG